MKKIMLTGFNPFGPYSFNPSQDLALYYDSKTITGQEKIIGVVLPCTYFGAFEKLSNLIDQEKPNAIISVGLSSSIKRIRIETVFQNIMDGKYPDTDGYNPKKIPINNLDGASKFLTANIESSFFSQILHLNNIPFEISTDADAFICNSLGYLTTQKIINDCLPIKNMFIYIPWTDNYSSRINLEPHKIFISKQELYMAIELLIKHI